MDDRKMFSIFSDSHEIYDSILFRRAIGGGRDWDVAPEVVRKRDRYGNVVVTFSLVIAKC